jgi:uncharacterized protein
MLTELLASTKLVSKHTNPAPGTVPGSFCGLGVQVIKLMKNIETLFMILLIVGGINWGLVGAFNYNLVTTLLGDGTMTKVIYGLVGVSALYQVMQYLKARMAPKSA